MKRTVCADGRRIEYILIQSVRKNVLLQALPEGQTRVYAPRQMRLRDVDALVRSSAGQIAQMHEKLDRQLDADRQAHPVTEGSAVAVEGEMKTLRLHQGRTRAEVRDDELHLWLNAPEDGEAVRAALKSTLAALALERIRQRIGVFQPVIGGEFGRVAVRDQRSRWGSCSSKHNLNFNWKLIMAPPQVLDYVVIHELCHLHEFNHSARFWRLVEGVMPDYEVWKKWLKNHGGELGV